MKFYTVMLTILIGGGIVQVSSAEVNKTIGWIEHVKLHNKNMLMEAKIDTGADNSSIHASGIELYEQNDIRMVKFLVENKAGEMVEFVKPLVRIAYIKRKGAEPLERPVVKMDLCIGNTLKTTDVNLANRKNFEYRMLIGRSFLIDHYLVNSSQKFTSEPVCTNGNIAQKTDT